MPMAVVALMPEGASVSACISIHNSSPSQPQKARLPSPAGIQSLISLPCGRC